MKLVATLTAFMAVMMSMPDAGVAGASPEQPVLANRVVPQVTPPKSGLEFSANPTTQEIFSRAGI